LGQRTLPVYTVPFGRQELQLAHLRDLRLPRFVEQAKKESAEVLPDPGNLESFKTQVGKKFQFRVTGALGGSVWGTDVYTSDSRLATAAVHAGIVRPGQTAVLRVTIVPALPAYDGSTRNGVTTSSYGAWPGAYKIERVRSKSGTRMRAG
jgi:hypothetical protein